MLLRRIVSILPSSVLLVSATLWAADLQVGFADFQLDSGGKAPAGVALFSLVNPQGILVSEAGVGAARLIRRGRIFVQKSSSWSTGIALANPAGRQVALRLVLRDTAGEEVARMERLDLEPHEHQARFVGELFAGLPLEMTGSLTFEVLGVDDRIAAVTLRQSVNPHGEPVFTTLPVANLDDAGSGSETSLIFPQVGAGNGLSTQLILISRSHSVARGKIKFTASDGTPLVFRSADATGSELPFQLPAQGVFFSELTHPPGTDLLVGYARVEVSEGQLPAGTAIFRFQNGAGPISEAGVPAMPVTRRARIFVDSDETATGFAIANPGTSELLITYRLLDGNGSELQKSQLPLPAGHHIARYASELFDLPDRFAGMMEIEGDGGFVPITLKFTSNARREPILTTLPVADMETPSSVSQLVFPQIASGGVPSVGESTTRLVFLGPLQEEAVTGTLYLWKGTGQTLRLDRISAQFRFAVEGGAAGQIFLTDRPFKTTLIKGSQTSQVIGPEGGILSLQDNHENLIVLEIPPLALGEPTTIRLTALESKPSATLGNSIFPGVALEPEGLVLVEPARLAIFLSEPIRNPDRTGLHWIDIDGLLRPLPNQLVAGQMLSADLEHFSEFTGEELNLSDVLMAAEVIFGMTDPAFRERARRYYEQKFGTSLSEDLVEMLVRLSDIESLRLYNGSLDALGVDGMHSPVEGWLEELALMILTRPLPGNRCGVYQSFLNRVYTLLPALGDPALEHDFRQRVDAVDEECISETMAGLWREEPHTQSELCVVWQGSKEVEIEEVDETEPYLIKIEQDGSRLEITFPGFPGNPSFSGQVRKTNDPAKPYRITASSAGSNTLDCITFFKSGGYDLEFGAPLCPSGSGCRPLSCSEYQKISGVLSPGGGIVKGIERWTFAASAVVYPDDAPAYLISVTCGGQGAVSAVKIE